MKKINKKLNELLKTVQVLAKLMLELEALIKIIKLIIELVR